MKNHDLRPIITSFVFLCHLAGAAVSPAGDLQRAVEFVRGTDKLTVLIDGLPVATYYFQHDEITRPFFAHVRAPGGVQVTRHHPPQKGFDLTDHATFHPGIWMAFGDLDGSDSWRMHAKIEHKEFVETPTSGPGRGGFAVRNRHLDQHDPSRVICREVARFTFVVRPAGYLLLWDSTFSSDEEFYFGDQEEMGLGLRVATAIRVGADGKEDVPPGSGTIRDASGRQNGKQIWGLSDKWCDYSGSMAGQHVGITLLVHRDNFGPSRFHARDYGFIAANPFGRASFGQGEPSRVVVRPGEELRLRYGLLLHAGPEGDRPDLDAAYEDYHSLSAD